MKLLRLITALLLLLARPSWAGPAEQCAKVRDDDTVQPYDRSLQAGLLTAYARLFPHAPMPPDERAFQAETHVRCMDGHLLACFTGANLPCSRMNTDHANHGAAAFCRSSPDAPFVPAFVAGHDSAYLFRCVAGRASVAGETFKLDPRGFAATLWAPLE